MIGYESEQKEPLNYLGYKYYNGKKRNLNARKFKPREE